MDLDIDKIVGEVHAAILEDTAFAKHFFLTLYRGESLSQYHHTLGTYIRNQYKLWDISWEPKMDWVGDVGYDASPDHPDAISMRIIEEVWKRGYDGYKT